MAKLQFLVDDVVVKTFPLNKTPMTIGRADSNDIVIDVEAVSGTHARIELIPNEYLDSVLDIFIEDLGSTNGTFVNEQPVKRHQLQNLDRIRIAWSDFKLVSDKEGEIGKTSVIAQ